jgi:hypothetical protein
MKMNARISLCCATISFNSERFSLPCILCQDFVDVSILIELLAMKLNNSDVVLSSQELSNCIYGLKSMRGSSSALDKLFEALIPKVDACPSPFSAQAVR